MAPPFVLISLAESLAKETGMGRQLFLYPPHRGFQYAGIDFLPLPPPEKKQDAPYASET
jgi:hypothetical protein